MESLKVVRDTSRMICYIATEKNAQEKAENTTSGFNMADEQLSNNIMTEYATFVEFGAKDTPSYIFTKGNDTDWFIAQVEVKHENIGMEKH